MAWWRILRLLHSGFREYLKKHATKEQLQQAGIEQIDDFDYRTLVRKHAKSRQEYKKVQHQIPLMDMLLQFRAEAAAERTRQLGQLAEDVASQATTAG